MADPTIPAPQPENARQAIHLVRDDHAWLRRDLDLNTTDGIQRNIRALWAAVDRLAGYVDGQRPTSEVTETLSADRPESPTLRHQ